MHGVLQTSFFFGYNAIACFAFFLLLGSIGWRASLLFVRSIYKVRAENNVTNHNVTCHQQEVACCFANSSCC
jgi:hypothetical protein